MLLIVSALFELISGCNVSVDIMEESATNGTAVNNGVIKLSNYCHL
jgi:hypothetical protein